MATLSIRGLDDMTAKTLKDQARRSGKSVNVQVPAHTDLDHLAGTWSAKEAREFAQRTAAFATVDEELWKR